MSAVLKKPENRKLFLFDNSVILHYDNYGSLVKAEVYVEHKCIGNHIPVNLLEVPNSLYEEWMEYVDQARGIEGVYQYDLGKAIA